MFKKTKVRSILELLGKDLSAREVSRDLGVSKNTVIEVKKLFEGSGFILTSSSTGRVMRRWIIPMSTWLIFSVGLR